MVRRRAVTEEQAVELIEDAELERYAQASVDYAQEIVSKCLAADIPAVIGRTDSLYRLDVLVRKEDVERVQEVLGVDWRAMAEREGTFEPGAGKPLEENEDGNLPCPACGTAAPLEDGACTDCGLQLE